MFTDDDVVALEIRDKIQARFPYADIKIMFDENMGEYFISTRNKELY